MRPLTSRTEEQKAVCEQADDRGCCVEGTRDIVASGSYVISRRAEEGRDVFAHLKRIVNAVSACDYEDQTLFETSPAISNLPKPRRTPA